MALPISGFGVLTGAAAEEQQEQGRRRESNASEGTLALSASPRLSTGNGHGAWTGGHGVSPTDRPLEHLLASVSQRVVHCAMQDACDLRAKLQMQETRYRLLQARALQRSGEQPKLAAQFAELREGLNELQAMRLDHGRVTAGAAGDLQQLAGTICVRSGQKMAVAGRAVRVSITPPRSPRALAAGPHQPVEGLADRIQRLEEQMRTLYVERHASAIQADGNGAGSPGSPLHCAAAATGLPAEPESVADAGALAPESAAAVPEVPQGELQPLDVQQECRRIQVAISQLVTRFDADYSQAASKIGQVQLEAETARRGCETLHLAVNALKEEVTSGVQDVFGDLWREYSVGMSSRFQRLREELVSVIGSFVKEQALGAGGTSAAAECRSLRAELSALGREVRQGAGPGGAAVAQLGVESDSVFVLRDELASLTRRLTSQERALQDLGNHIKEGQPQEFSISTPMLPMSPRGVAAAEAEPEALRRLREEMGQLRERVEREFEAMPHRLAEAAQRTASEDMSRRASVQTAEGNGRVAEVAQGFKHLLQTLEVDQKAERHTNQRVFGQVEAAEDMVSTSSTKSADWRGLLKRLGSLEERIGEARRGSLASDRRGGATPGHMDPVDEFF